MTQLRTYQKFELAVQIGLTDEQVDMLTADEGDWDVIRLTTANIGLTNNQIDKLIINDNQMIRNLIAKRHYLTPEQIRNLCADLDEYVIRKAKQKTNFYVTL